MYIYIYIDMHINAYTTRPVHPLPSSTPDEPMLVIGGARTEWKRRAARL